VNHRTLRFILAVLAWNCGPGEILVGRDAPESNAAGAGGAAGNAGTAGSAGGSPGGAGTASGGAGTANSQGGAAGNENGGTGGAGGADAGASGATSGTAGTTSGGAAGTTSGGAAGATSGGAAGAGGQEGPCGTPGAPIVCGPTEFCDHEDKACGLVAQGGTCKPRPQLAVCPAQCNPICACDGVSYCNECHANNAGVDANPAGSCP
jgi:hypothetical protein